MFTLTSNPLSTNRSCINKPVPLYNYSGSNKENQNPFSLKKLLNYPLSEPESHSHNNKPKDLHQLTGLYPYQHSETSHSSMQVSMGLDLTTKKSSGTKDSVSRCEHKDVKSYKRSYCKDCGIFLPKNGAETYRERCFNIKMDSHPDEVHKIMLENQRKNREYIKESAHLKDRKVLVDWISETAGELKFFFDTIYTAISYLDTILTKVEIPQKRLQLIGLCCLAVAGKFCEKEEKVPTYKELYDMCRGVYSVDLFKRTETFVLEMLNWSLKTITPFQFIQFYLSKGCVFSTDKSVIRDVDSKLLRYLRKYSEFFIDLSLQNYRFSAYESNIVACSAICGARKAVGLHPIWSPELQELTSIAWQELESCYNMLYSSFEVAFPEIASKANSFANKVQKKGDVGELEKSYAAMSIENTLGTPFKNQQAWREQRNADYSSTQKEKAPSVVAISERGGDGKLPEWNLPRRKADRLEEKNVRNIGIKLFKKVDENEMNIENICEELIKRDTMNSKVKRNLIF